MNKEERDQMANKVNAYSKMQNTINNLESALSTLNAQRNGGFNFMGYFYEYKENISLVAHIKEGIMAQIASLKFRQDDL